MATEKEKELQKELEASQKAAADNLDLAQLAEKTSEELTVKLDSANSRISELAQQLAASQDDTRIQVEARSADAAKVHELMQENDIYKKVNEELSLKIEELSAPKNLVEAAEKITAAVVPVIPESPFTVDGVSYKFISPVFVFKKERIVAADIINNQAKLDELVAAGVGSIVKAS